MTPSSPSSLPIVVIGAGVLGLCTAFELHRRGHAVRVIDPGQTNASEIAAGMIAPAMEAAIDDVTPDYARLFRAGRDLWPDFATAAGIVLSRRAAEWRGGDVEGMAARMSALGFRVRLQTGRVSTDEDFQVEPVQALSALKRALAGSIETGHATHVSQTHNGWRVALGDRSLNVETLVLATGAGPAIGGLPDAVRRQIEAIQPIRGQIGVTDRSLADHVVRGPGVYVAPMATGGVIGATMETGRRDTAPDVQAAARLTEAAWRVLEQPSEVVEIDWRVGVRGASADGLPLAGAAPGGQGLFMALAPRRNGWLLGPLVGSVTADAIESRKIEGAEESPHARAFDPLRF